MFIAHLPAGYLLADRLIRDRPDRAALMTTGLIASVFPDTDLLWFYLANDRQHAHHAYVFHWPLFWVGLAAMVWLLCRLLGWHRAGPYVGIALAGVLLHMVLDSVAADIGWLQPLSDWRVNLVPVQARHEWCIWNFILHWSFALELLIVSAAGVRLWQRKQARI